MSLPLLTINLAALALAMAWLALLTFPPRQAVRVRNAFLLRRGRPQDFLWAPSAAPSDFRIERAAAPKPIQDAVAAAGIPGMSGDWQRALALVGMLVRHARHEGGIQADLVTTYARIVAGHGYCADFVRVYMAAAPRVDLFCRQWAFSFDGFGGHGHTFVEVYDRQREAWAFLDVHNNVYAVVAGAEAPADALCLHDALRDAPSTVEFRQAGPGRLGWPHPEKLLAYYVRGANHWYLWWGNDVVSRESRGLVGKIGRLSGHIAHVIGSAIGSLPPLVVLTSPENEDAIARMERLRRSVLAASLLLAGLAAALGVQLGWQWLQPRQA
jgi:hypothetical protein